MKLLIGWGKHEVAERGGSGNRDWLIVLEPYGGSFGILQAVLILGLSLLMAGVGALLAKFIYPFFVRTWPSRTDTTSTAESQSSQSDPLKEFKTRRKSLTGET